jgi:phosphopantetheinyl transferase (holo-ACP synthase)
MAETMAADAGITGMSLSLTHEGPYAAAIVLAVCGNRPTSNGEANA